ncbi:ATP-binding cassette, subfamily B, member 1 [Bisporella sp. PMI_857]|nr:ATP-binding cassette, subfamily B, member 1 [Bisporella sp. PMI_857]
MDEKTRQPSDSNSTIESVEENPPGEKSGSIHDYIRIFQYADKTDWILNVISLLTCIGSGVVLPLMTVVFGNSITLFNDFSGPNTAKFRREVLKMVLWFVYLFIAKLVLTYVSMVTISISAIRTTRSLRQAFMNSMLRKEIWHFDHQDSSAVAVLVTTNGARITKGISDKLAITIQQSTTFFAAFIVALVVQWKLTLITITIVPVIVITTGVCVALDTKVESKVMRTYSRAASMAQEAISTIRTVHAFWAQSKMLTKYDVYLTEAHTEGRKRSLIYAIMFSSETFLIYSMVALAFWQGYRMFISGEVSNVGKVFTVVFSVIMAATTISAMAPQIPVLTNAAAAASEIFELIDEPTKLDPLSKSGEKPSTCKGQIEVKDVHFSYPSRPSVKVLKGLTLSIPAGKTTALVGASGCGKSTLVGLLERWYERNSGTIELDGLDIVKHNTRWLRSEIGLVQQEPVLFQGTVFENVANGFRDNQKALSKQEQLALIKVACQTSNAHEFITELPNGYDTDVGESAALLSGGQRQRIAIARSIVSNPKILLLDEATSALDPRAEGIVQNALDQAAVDRTTLVIAHKLATIKNADNIAVISNGVVVEQGTHDDLLLANGHYAKLVAAQDIGGTNDYNRGSDVSPESDAGQIEKTDHLTQQTSLFKPSTQGQEGEKSEETIATMGYSLLKCIWIMFAENKSLYPLYALSVFWSLVIGATYPGQAVIFSRIFHVFTLEEAEGRKKANFWSLMFFVIALGNLFAYAAIGAISNTIGQTVTHRYRKEIFQNMLRQDMDFFSLPGNTSGALTSKLSSAPSTLQDLLSFNIWLILIVIISVTSSSILALAFGWKLGLVVVFGGLPPLILSGYIRIRLETFLEAKNSARFAESAGIANEAVNAIKTVSSLTLESSILARYEALLSGIVKTSITTLLWTLGWYALSQSLEFLVMALGFWYGSELLIKGEYTITQFFVIFIAVLFAGQQAAQFFGYTTSITSAGGAANYILWLRFRKPVMQENISNLDQGPSDEGGDISLSEMSFRYRRTTARVLREISMTIKHGDFAAFVGPSGCGKSTMVSLLERFYDPTSGAIHFDGKDISTFSPRLYRQNISLVQQEPTLYSGSISENVSVGLETEATEEQILTACRQANALEFVDSLPEGLATPCGNRGLQFSGGQKQRIAIARALIRKPRLLLLDEATSALDTQSERIVQEALDQAKEGRTTIAVAHRLSTIKGADAIFVFGDGRVVEQGTHEELLAKRGRYYDMCLAQSLDRDVS